MSFTTVNNINVYSDSRAITAQLPIIVQSPKFIKYIDRLDLTVLDISGIRIDAVKWFGSPEPSKLGFLYMEVIALDRRSNTPVPGVVFLRGNAVAVYIRVEVDGRKYVILTKQMRIPKGQLMEELPAGMMDANDCFAGVAIKEIEEETGLPPPRMRDLIPLGSSIVPSAGGCDETIQLFYWETQISAELKTRMRERIYGSKDENESIQIIFVPVEEYEARLLRMGDVKAICAHHFAKQLGLLQEECWDFKPHQMFIYVAVIAFIFYTLYK
jgi:8-oxo-dGTP pyrophosphatase MutT (NUDIX family)